MKHIGAIALLTVLVSCGGSSGGSKSQGSYIDPLTVDKVEEQLRDRHAGMVSITTTTGTTLDISVDEATGRIQGTPVATASVEKDTLLKVDGDTLYVLEEETGDDTSRRVKKQSIEQIVKEARNPEPGTSITSRGNTLTMSMKQTESHPMETGPKDKYTISIAATLTAALDNIRCTGKFNAMVSYSMVQGGKVTKFPSTGSTGIMSCGKDLTAAELKALDLTNMTLCDETTGEPEDDEDEKCQYGVDLSYLVK